MTTPKEMLNVRGVTEKLLVNVVPTVVVVDRGYCCCCRLCRDDVRMGRFTGGSDISSDVSSDVSRMLLLFGQSR